MTVYVDDMKAPFGSGRRKMIMSHMIATDEDELHSMAVKIGVARKWYQGDHYDVAQSKKAEAIAHGAVLITWRQAGAMNGLRRRGHEMGDPETAPARLQALFKLRRLEREAAETSTPKEIAQ